MSKKTLHLLHLYPNEMNIYGDMGNVLCLRRRAQWHGYDVKLTPFHIGDDIPDDIDLIVGGGGQDSGQSLIQHDLQRIGDQLHVLTDAGTPMLMICGLYQLFGRFFQLADGSRIPGIGIFGAETYASDKRLIGNIVTNSLYGELIGYENHSGLTVLDDDQHPLGHVVRGAGNNDKDGTEGAVTNHVIGSYLHGSLLPKNPVLADTLISWAVEKRYGSFEPQTIDDELANRARSIARKRPR